MELASKRLDVPMELLIRVLKQNGEPICSDGLIQGCPWKDVEYEEEDDGYRHYLYPKYVQEINGEIQLMNGSYHDGDVKFDSFAYQGIDYRVCSDGGLSNKTIGMFDLYCRDDWDDESKAKIGINDPRIAACKAFLLKDGAATTQEGYEKLGEPTKDGLWAMLQKDDPKLFNAGKDKLFRASEKDIGFSFKEGRRKKK